MPRIPQPPPFDGILVVDKPSGRTSHDVVEAVRRLSGFRQIGHLGTLDPLATGVLVLALGRATRLARFYTGRRKRYACAVRFGFATDTYDADGEPLGPDSAPLLDAEEIARLAAKFVGSIEQTPPQYSAKKIHGRPAHELARKHKPVKLEPVNVEVYEFRLTSVEGAVARFVVECGAGTYIRSLADDLGKLHGANAHLAEITRTAVGEFTLDQAIPLAELAEDAKAGRLAERVIRFRQGLPGLHAVNSLFPVQPLELPATIDAHALHRALLGHGVRSVLHRDSRSDNPRISFVLTARHRLSEIDHAVESLADLVCKEPSGECIGSLN